MTYESFSKLIKEVAEQEIEKSISYLSTPIDTATKISNIIIKKLKEEDKNNSVYTFIILGDYESELLKEIIHGDKLSVDEYNYVVYSDSEIVFSIPQENVVYVKKGWCLIEYIFSNVWQRW